MVIGIVQNGDAVKYTVKFPFGLSTLSPSAILHAVQDRSSPYVRREGKMVVDELKGGTALYGAKLSDRYQLLFGTENIYLFLRRYSLLCQLLSAIRELCETMEPPVDPEVQVALAVQGDPLVDPEATSVLLRDGATRISSGIRVPQMTQVSS